MKESVSLLELVQAEAKRTLKSKKETPKTIHNQICKDLVSYMNESGFPITILVYIGVGTNAHRPMIFQQGYKKFDKERTDKVIKFCNIFSKKFGENYKTNALVAHGICRFIDMNGTEKKFRQLVKESNFEMKGIKTAKDLMQKLCGESAIYSESGYITKFIKK